jgi:hypothetical protein
LLSFARSCLALAPVPSPPVPARNNCSWEEEEEEEEEEDDGEDDDIYDEDLDVAGGYAQALHFPAIITPGSVC